MGDALGAPVEFMKPLGDPTPVWSKRHHHLCPRLWRPGHDHRRYADDAVHSRGPATSLGARFHSKGITTYSGVTAHAYLRWLQTQGERPTCHDFSTSVMSLK